MPSYLYRTLTASTVAVCLSFALASCGDDPAGPDPVTLPMTWDFDSGLEGWTLGGRSGGDGAGAASHDQANGRVVLSGYDSPGVADAWMSREVALPDVDLLWIDASVTADCVLDQDHDSFARIVVTEAGGATSVVEDWTEVDDFTLPGRMVGGSLEAFRGKTVTITIEQDDEGEQQDPDEPEAICVDFVSIFVD